MKSLYFKGLGECGTSCLWAWVILTHTPPNFSRVNLICVKSLLLSIIASGCLLGCGWVTDLTGMHPIAHCRSVQGYLAITLMSPGFGTLGWRCHLADVPGQLDHPCCASFGLAICHTGSVFWLGSAICRRDISMYVYQASPRGCGPCVCYKPSPI